jgi:hypothetical protein
VAGEALSPRAAPQFPQKRYSGGLAVPQAEQTCARRVPHIPQNLIPGGESKPQFGHFIKMIILVLDRKYQCLPVEFELCYNTYTYTY